MGDKYPKWWPTSMGGSYSGPSRSGGFGNSDIPKKHSQEGSSYNEKYKPQIRETKEFSYLSKPTISERSGGGNINKWKVTPQAQQDEKCPMCGGIMRRKKGKFGEFLGCSNYPRCRYTRT